MSVQRKPDMQHLPPDIDRILLGGRIGIIANAIAGKLDIDSVRALELFYERDLQAPPRQDNRPLSFR